jgi:L,D-transpeptidase catalytic domain
MTRRLPIVAAVPVALALAAPAAAQTPSAPSDPIVTPQDARMSIAIKSGRVDRDRRWALAGDKLLVRGHMWPYAEGQRVTLELYRSGTLVDSREVKVEKDETRTNAGKYQNRFKIKDDGSYSVVAKHAATPEQAEGESDTEKVRVISAHVRGEESTRLLQISLNSLAYVSPVNGKLDDATRRAVLAFRKVQNWRRTGSPTSDVFRRVFNGGGAFKLRHGDPSKHVEGDLKHQVIVLVDPGRPDQIYTMSSGKPSTPTVKGTFKFYRSQPGSNSHGMYYTRYFYRGYAVHGYPSVPATYPASHGCLRVPIPDAYRIYKSIYIGETIYVYG